MSNTKAFIDYAMQDSGSEAREVLYSEIHDRVMSHIEAKKMEIAGGIINNEELDVPESPEIDEDGDWSEEPEEEEDEE